MTPGFFDRVPPAMLLGRGSGESPKVHENVRNPESRAQVERLRSDDEKVHGSVSEHDLSLKRLFPSFTSALIALSLVSHVQGQNPIPASVRSTEHPLRTVAEEAAVLENGRLTARQHGFARLAMHTDPEASKVLLSQFERYRAGTLPPTLWLDLLEAASKRKDPALNVMLAEREKELAKSNDPLIGFRECLQGGNADAGRAIFATKPEAGCIRCHSVDGKGGAIGPELTWLRHSADRIHILESLILPSAALAPGFQPAALQLRNGEKTWGVITLESTDELTITSVLDGKKRNIKLTEITERTPLPSPMPPYYGLLLSKREIRDLMEFLAEGD